MRENQITSKGAVGQPARECESRRRCRHRFETEMLQVMRGADIPRIRDRKATAPMQFTKDSTFLFYGGHRSHVQKAAHGESSLGIVGITPILTLYRTSLIR